MALVMPTGRFKDKYFTANSTLEMEKFAEVMIVSSWEPFVIRLLWLIKMEYGDVLLLTSKR
jgi:hypothetical protein